MKILRCVASGRRRPGSKTPPRSHLACQRGTAAMVVVAVVVAVALEVTEEGGNAVWERERLAPLFGILLRLAVVRHAFLPKRKYENLMNIFY